MHNCRKESVIISNPNGLKLNGMLTLQNKVTNVRGIALVCHPASMGPGGMNNPVVTTLAECAARQGYMVLCFDRYPHISSTSTPKLGEQVETALRFLWEKVSELNIDPKKLHSFGMGYSYGGARITELAQKFEATKDSTIKIDALLTYEPALNNANNTYPKCPSHIVYGTKSAYSVPQLSNVTTAAIAGSDHFNVNLAELKSIAKQYIRQTKKAIVAHSRTSVLVQTPREGTANKCRECCIQ